MTFHGVVRSIHVVAGVSGLALGAVGMSTPKDWRLHPWAGECYFVATTVACASAVVIAISEWSRLWYFLILAVGTYAFAVVGYMAGKRRKREWLLVHVVGLTSSYCGLAMAFLVGRFGIMRIFPSLARFPFFVRLAPLMFVSTCAVLWAGVQVFRGRIPKSWARARHESPSGLAAVRPNSR